MVNLAGGQPPTDSTVVGWWPLTTGGPVVETFCPTAHLFCSTDHLDRWRDEHGGARGEALALEDLAARGRCTWPFLIRDRKAGDA